MAGTKDSIRREMLSRRRALSPARIEAAESAILEHVCSLAEYRRSSSILAYAAVDGELPTGRLIAAAFADGKSVFLPRVDGSAMSFAEHRFGAVLRPGRFGIPQADGTTWIPDDGPTVALVPTVAWDGEGARLGRGRGHYDRAFATRREDVVLIGLAYAFQQCASIPRDPWDVLLDLVVSERGPVRCRDGDGPSPVRKEDTTQHGNPTDRGQPGSGRGARVVLPARAAE